MDNTRMYYLCKMINYATKTIAFITIVIAILGVDSEAYLEIFCLLGIGALFGLAAFLSEKLSFFYKREVLYERERAARKKRRDKIVFSGEYTKLT